MAAMSPELICDMSDYILYRLAEVGMSCNALYTYHRCHGL